MIIELHLTLLEEAENDAHLDACREAACKHQAHMVRLALAGSCRLVEVFEFVEDSTASYARRLRHNKERREREADASASRKQEGRSLATIRRGWDQLYGAEGL